MKCIAATTVAACLAGALMVAAAPVSWPGFRGPSASGVADGQRLPDTWDAYLATLRPRFRTKVRSVLRQSCRRFEQGRVVAADVEQDGEVAGPDVDHLVGARAHLRRRRARPTVGRRARRAIRAHRGRVMPPATLSPSYKSVSYT